MPEGRQKYLHGVGAVCKFTLDIQDSPYTGLFKNGVQTGIIRIGSALDIGGGSEYGAGLFPGAGIKFLRTGKSSGNFVIGINTKKSYNIFDPDLYPMYNHLSRSLQRWSFVQQVLTRKWMSNKSWFEWYHKVSWAWKY